MSHSMMRLSSFVMLCLLLTACGFTPVYQQGLARQTLAEVAVDTPNTREGQWLRKALEDTLAPYGQHATPRYRLTPNFSVVLEPLSIESDGTTRRYRMLGTANVTLTDTSNGKIIFTTLVHRFSSYHISEGDYSTYVAQQDATHQLVSAVAEEIRLRLISFLVKNGGRDI
jgi:LPS-assembly lipoprotein